MKRRKFTQSLLTGAGLSSLPIGLSLAAKAPLHDLQKSTEALTSEGLKLSLKQQVNPTVNKDNKQFILTYDVKNSATILEEKIYDLKIAGGQTHQVFMSPVGENQLQAIFNWRLNA